MSWHPASGSPDWVLLRLIYVYIDWTAIRRPEPTGPLHRVPMNSCPHDWFSAKRRARRQVPLIELPPVGRWIYRPGVIMSNVDEWVLPWPAFDMGQGSALGAPDCPLLQWHQDNRYLPDYTPITSPGTQHDRTEPQPMGAPVTGILQEQASSLRCPNWAELKWG